jgi:hypothetical protein
VILVIKRVQLLSTCRYYVKGRMWKGVGEEELKVRSADLQFKNVVLALKQLKNRKQWRTMH